MPQLWSFDECLVYRAEALRSACVRDSILATTRCLGLQLRFGTRGHPLPPIDRGSSLRRPTDSPRVSRRLWGALDSVNFGPLGLSLFAACRQQDDSSPVREVEGDLTRNAAHDQTQLE